ncbi:hypothetical protein COB52_03200 [Candidatus Kaiserbacteria bacterium]|nr:MAG: hypothetical protein COB52_03200 [Candidatus Kaiserbacteria bacterium]
MTKIGRQLKDLIILDNSPMSYLFQPENAIPSLSWYNNKSDKELLKLIPILERLSVVNDVRDHIKTFVSSNHIDYQKASRFIKSVEDGAQQRSAS